MIGRSPAIGGFSPAFQTPYRDTHFTPMHTFEMGMSPARTPVMNNYLGSQTPYTPAYSTMNYSGMASPNVSGGVNFLRQQQTSVRSPHYLQSQIANSSSPSYGNVRSQSPSYSPTSSQRSSPSYSPRNNSSRLENEQRVK